MGSCATPISVARLRNSARVNSKLDPETVLLIEPQFLNDLDVAAQHLPAETLHWAHTGWEGGEDAHGPAPISSFAAIDAILARLADRASFPALRNVVVAGHSGGGQLVQRYAIAGRGDSALTKAGIHVRYVVSNPSSYAYFSPERPTGDGFATFDAADLPLLRPLEIWHDRNCRPTLRVRTLRRWKRPMPHATSSISWGTGDDDPNHRALDKTCMAEAQGPYRYARGLAYFHYLQRRHPSRPRASPAGGAGHRSQRRRHVQFALRSRCPLRSARLRRRLTSKAGALLKGRDQRSRLHSPYPIASSSPIMRSITARPMLQNAGSRASRPNGASSSE